MAPTRTGRVRELRLDMGFGLIRPDNGWGDVVVHAAELDALSRAAMAIGEQVEYQAGIGRAGQVTALKVRSLRRPTDEATDAGRSIPKGSRHRGHARTRRSGSRRKAHARWDAGQIPTSLASRDSVVMGRPERA